MAIGFLQDGQLVLEIYDDSDHNYGVIWSTGQLTEYRYHFDIATWQQVNGVDLIFVSASQKDTYRGINIKYYLSTRNQRMYSYNKVVSPLTFRKHSITTGDFDGESTRLTYCDTEMKIEDPQIMAIAAAAPNIPGISHSIDLCGTSIGWYKGSGDTTGGGMSLNSKTTLSYSGGVSFFGMGLKVKGSQSFLYSHESSSTTTKTVTVTKSFNFPWNEHGVVFQADMYNQISFNIIQEGVLTGEKVYINTPSDTIVQQMELTNFINMYKEDFPEFEHLDEVFSPYEIGNPFSYLTRDNWVATYGSSRYSKAMKTPQGIITPFSEGFVQVMFDKDRETVDATQESFGHETGVEITAGPVTFAQDFSHEHFTISESISTSGFFVEAGIGGLTGPSLTNVSWDYDQFRYLTQTIIYKKSLNDAQGPYNYLVIDYAVDPVGFVQTKDSFALSYAERAPEYSKGECCVCCVEPEASSTGPTAAIIASCGVLGLIGTITLKYISQKKLLGGFQFEPTI